MKITELEYRCLVNVVEAIEGHMLHNGPVGLTPNPSDVKTKGGFLYVKGCYCTSCTAHHWRHKYGGAK